MDCISSEECGCIIYLVFWTVILLLIIFAILYWVTTRHGEPLVIYAYDHIVDLQYRSMKERMTPDEAENTLEKIDNVRWWLFILSPARREEIEEELHGLTIYCREIISPRSSRN